MTLDVRDNAALMIPQYEGTKTQDAAEAFLSVVQRSLVEPAAEMESVLDDMYGFMLDEAGARLGFARPEVPGDLEYWGFAPEDSGFGRGVLSSSTNPTPAHLPGAPAGDDQYRRMLKARGVVLRSAGGTRAEVSAAVERLLGDGGRYAIRDGARGAVRLGSVESLFGWADDSLNPSRRISGMCRVGDELRVVNTFGDVAAIDPLTLEVTHYTNFDVPGADKYTLTHARGYMWTILEGGGVRRFPWPSSPTDNFVFLGYQGIGGQLSDRNASSSGPLAIGDALYIVNVDTLYEVSIEIDTSFSLPQDSWRISFDGHPTRTLQVLNVEASATDGVRLFVGNSGGIFEVNLATGQNEREIDTSALDMQGNDALRAMALHAGSMYAAVQAVELPSEWALWRIPLEPSDDQTHFELVLTGIDRRYAAMIRENADMLIPRSPGVSMTISTQAN